MWGKIAYVIQENTILFTLIIFIILMMGILIGLGIARMKTMSKYYDDLFNRLEDKWTDEEEACIKS